MDFEIPKPKWSEFECLPQYINQIESEGFSQIGVCIVCGVHIFLIFYIVTFYI